ncbi:MAG: hypothetical protein ACQESF_01820 [Nanobdellota archaeon]
MGIETKLKDVVKAVGLPIIFSVGVFTGYNFYSHHNVSYETQEKKVFQKVDGVMSHTTLEFNKENGAITLIRDNFLDLKIYKDTNGDRRVDSLYELGNPFLRGSHPRSFERDEDFEQYTMVFEDADWALAKQLKRFRTNRYKLFIGYD